jgi:hypothetical protein
MNIVYNSIAYKAEKCRQIIINNLFDDYFDNNRFDDIYKNLSVITIENPSMHSKDLYLNLIDIVRPLVGPILYE